MVKLDSIVPWGRSFDEYVRMFALSEVDLLRTILDCAAGPSSFNAEMAACGKHVVAVDPIYAFPPEQIRLRVGAVRDTMIDQVRGQMGRFSWEYFESPEHLERVRMGAMEKFLEDFAAGGRGGRYLPQSLPTLALWDRAFDLALCSHFLFLYSDRLDAAFHLESVAELLRVAREVRVFPVTDLSGRYSPHLEPVRERFTTELVRVPYEFLRGANEMLIVKPEA